MRLSESQIKDALLHEELFVRRAALISLTQSFTTDADVTLRVLEANDRYGWGEAFGNGMFYIHRLPQTAETIDALLDRLDAWAESHGDDLDLRASSLVRMAIGAAPSALTARLARLREAPGLLSHHHADLDARLRFAEETADHLWAQFVELCEGPADRETLNGPDVEDLFRVAEEISRRPELSARVLEVLARPCPTGDEETDYADRIEMQAAQIAGLMRLESAVPDLVKRLYSSDVDLCEDCSVALARIGGRIVVEPVMSLFSDAEWPVRLYATEALASQRSDEAIGRMIDLLAGEENPEVKVELARVPLLSFESAGIEPALSMLGGSPGDSLRGLILAVSVLMDAEVPNQDELLAKQRKADQREAAWAAGRYDPNSRPEIPIGGSDEDDDCPLWGPAPLAASGTSSERITVPDPIRKEPTPGRNEPCPCGSGKKYKKCCMP